MTYADVMQFFKTQGALGAALGIAQPTISSWDQGDGHVVPDRYQYQLEVITGGALRVERALRKPKAGKIIGHSIFEY